VHYGLAQAERDQDNLIEARAQIEATLNIIESTRAQVVSQYLRSTYLASNESYYEFYIDLLMRMHHKQPAAGYDAAALQASERARARGLLDILTEARADIRQGVDIALLESERSLQQQLNAKSERLTRLLSSKHSDEQDTAARKEVETLLTDYQDVETQIRIKSPRYAALTQPQPLSSKEIQQLLDKDTLLLEYSLGEERSYLWAVTPTSITGYELPKRVEVEAAARRVYDLLVAKADALHPDELTALSQMLLKPVADRLERKRLIIVGTGALQYVPFGALPAPERQGPESRGQESRISKHISFHPLIVNHEIVTLPSASVITALRQDLSLRKAAARKVAVFADPVFSKDDQRVKSKTGRQQAVVLSGDKKEIERVSLPSDVERSASDFGLTSFDRLLVSRREADFITTLVPRSQSLKALDFDASRATATSPKLENYQIVHFATHSLLNSQHPELSGIVLSLVDEEGKPQDGFLRLHEIYNLKLGADLVVLSSCQSALGKEIKGEGLVGLTRGFMYAGAPRVVTSLWKVSDTATAELMKRFYQKMLRERLRPAAALRAAQVSMLEEKQWAAPYYWAGFVLQGEWR
jgi:CHAT domain-containing protein